MTVICEGKQHKFLEISDHAVRMEALQREASKTDSDVKSEPVCDVIDYDGCFSEGDEGIWGGMWEQEVLIKEGGELSPWSSHSLMLTLTQSHVLPHKHSVHKQIQPYTFMNS